MSKENTLNMEGIEYPVSLKDLNKFEKQNPTISITVLGYERKGVYPLRSSDCMDKDHNIVLILIEEGGVKKYCLVKSINRLLSSQVANGKRKEHFCLRCLNPFWCQEALSRHQEHCNEYEAVKIELPKKGTMLEFKNYHKMEKVPFIVYADFERFIKLIQSCDPNPKNCDGTERSYTKQYQKHEPSSFCYYIKCFDGGVYEPKLVSYTGEDAAQKFVEMLEEDIREITSIPGKKMLFRKEEKERFDKETKCWICNGEFDDDVKKTVRLETIDILLVGIEAPHTTYVILSIENLILHLWCFINLFIKNVGFSEGNIDCIPNNEERYISFTNKIQVGSYTRK